MSRKTKTGAADDVVEIIAMLPWWGGVAMALVFSVHAHHTAR